ncbi:MAG: hypothetical protein N4A33_09600 [Bacteriovoracaceae bacterium]|jgi:hypothetical protein|nr:hypothetical protein [Bacteriovoracaceae bacterium]
MSYKTEIENKLKEINEKLSLNKMLDSKDIQLLLLSELIQEEGRSE